MSPFPVMRLAGLSLVLIVAVASAQAQATINVPADQPTIQAGINAANNGDTVLVAPGTYVENINFAGKAITVRSSGGSAATIIDGNAANSVVTFATGEGAAAVLQGFTIRNGLALTGTLPTFGAGGGIRITRASPTILDNTITGNQGCNGIGIAIDHASPLVQDNVISNNVQSGCSGGIGGGGISVLGSGPAQIIDNIISGNVLTSANGGGISLFGAGAAVIRGNTIRDNSTSGLSPATQGGGLWIVNAANELIVQNLIVGNMAGQGGGIAFLVPSGEPGPTLINNTIVGNDGAQGSAIFAQGFDSQVTVTNNLLIGKTGQTAVYCDGTFSSDTPIWRFNDAHAPSGVSFGGICPGQAGTNGNISSDPLFLDQLARDFHLTAGSPAIDAGDNAVAQLPDKDFDGNPRILDGNGDGTATVDMGIYELLPSSLDLSPGSLTFPSQLVTTGSSSLPVTLRNPGAVALHINSIATSGDFSRTSSCGATLNPGASCTVNVTFTPTGIGPRSGSLTITDSAPGSPHVVLLNGTGVDFVLTVSPTTQAINRPHPATYTVTVTPLGGAVNVAVNLSCLNLTAGLSCSFSPGSVTPGANPGTATLKVGTTGRASLQPPSGSGGLLSYAVLLLIPGMLPLALVNQPRSSRERLRRFLIPLLLLALSLPLVFRGSAVAAPSRPHSFSVKVVGTSGSVQRATTLTLTVR